MPQPQQPELRRSNETPAVEDHDKTTIGVGGPSGNAADPPLTVPDENQPGHHPNKDQDKPDLDAFADRLGIDRD
jgi:hypothetical protein